MLYTTPEHCVVFIIHQKNVLYTTPNIKSADAIYDTRQVILCDAKILEPSDLSP